MWCNTNTIYTPGLCPNNSLCFFTPCECNMPRGTSFPDGRPRSLYRMSASSYSI